MARLWSLNDQISFREYKIPSQIFFSFFFLSFFAYGQTFSFKVCLFELMLNVPDNSKVHVGTLPPFYGAFTQNEDIMSWHLTSANKGLYVWMVDLNHFSWAGSNQSSLSVIRWSVSSV